MNFFETDGMIILMILSSEQMMNDSELQNSEASSIVNSENSRLQNMVGEVVK